MKKFEVGKFYENRTNGTIRKDSFVEIWQCIKIKNNKATFKLAKFLRAKAGTEDFKEENFISRKYLCRIVSYVGGTFEFATNKSHDFIITAFDEVKDD